MAKNWNLLNRRDFLMGSAATACFAMLPRKAMAAAAKEESLMNFYEFDHFHLFTSDPKATAEWYHRMFDAEIIESVQSDGKIRFDMKLCGMMVYLSDGKLAARLEKNPAGKPDPAPPRAYFGLDHFGFRVKNLDEAVKELKKRGAEFAIELTTIRPGARLAYVRGPDMVRIELVERDLSLDSKRS